MSEHAGDEFSCDPFHLIPPSRMCPAKECFILPMPIRWEELADVVLCGHSYAAWWSRASPTASHRAAPQSERWSVWRAGFQCTSPDTGRLLSTWRRLPDLIDPDTPFAAVRFAVCLNGSWSFGVIHGPNGEGAAQAGGEQTRVVRRTSGA
jgi:hypothetical protein